MVAPTLVAGLGSVLVLRAGRVVGEAGGFGALLIWAAACVLTACTAASLAAMLTNARADAPSTLGAIRGSLGRGVASLVGLPMWFARGLATATAAFAIAESSPQLEASEVLVALCTVGLAGLAAWQGAPLVARAAPFALGAVGLGLASTLAGPASARAGAWLAPADYGGLLAWVVPVAAAVWVAPDGVAATGEVRRPSPAWWALGIGWLAQLAVVAWFTQVAPSATLIASPRLAIDGAAIPVVARLGLVVGAAYLAVASLADGARMIREIAGSAVSSLERPGMAELATTGVALAAVVSLRDLDGTATVLTLALLFTFAAINTVVGIELALGLTSFRPSHRLSTWIPLLGAISAACAMLLTHAAGALALTAVVLGVAGYLVRPERTAREHSALVSAMAEWLARRTSARHALRAWKPSMLVPLTDPEEVRPLLELLADILRPEGSIRFLGVRRAGTDLPEDAVQRLSDAARAQGLDSDASRLDDIGVDPTALALQTLRLAVFRPNLLVLRLAEDAADDAARFAQIRAARTTGVGVLLIGTPPNTPVVAARRTITLWVQNRPGLWDPLDGYEGRNLDLTLLIGFRLARRWGSQLRLVTVVTEPEHRIAAEDFLAGLCRLARLPPDTIRLGIVGTFEQAVEDLSNADLDVFGLEEEADFALARRLVERARSTCLFVVDSGRESALV